MIPDTSSFSDVLSQEFVPYDPSQNKLAIQALYGFSSPDQAEGYFYPDPALPAHNPWDFFDQQYQVPMNLHASPGAFSYASLPPSPFSSGDDLSELGVMDAPVPYDSNLSPTGLSILTPLVDTNDVKPNKSDLDGFEYHPATRKWVCTKCSSDFVSTHEARRHVKTAYKCTGKKVKCLRCGDRIHASQWSRKRHFGSKKCQKKGRKRGTPSYTVHNAYVEAES